MEGTTIGRVNPDVVARGGLEGLDLDGDWKGRQLGGLDPDGDWMGQGLEELDPDVLAGRGLEESGRCCWNGIGRIRTLLLEGGWKGLIQRGIG